MTNRAEKQDEDTIQVGDPRLKRLFWKRVSENPVTGCWEWGGYLDPDGYGSFGAPPNRMSAHRMAYTKLVGPIPDGMHLDHLCRVRNCVNPQHLEPVTSHENSRRGNSWVHVKQRPACPHGHPYDQANTGINAAGHRFCRACRRARYENGGKERIRLWRQRRRDEGVRYEA